MDRNRVSMCNLGVNPEKKFYRLKRERLLHLRQQEDYSGKDPKVGSFSTFAYLRGRRPLEVGLTGQSYEPVPRENGLASFP